MRAKKIKIMSVSLQIRVGGVSRLFKMKLNEFHFCKQYCIFLWINIYRKNINIKCPSLSASRIVGEAFFQSSSVYYVLF